MKMADSIKSIASLKTQTFFVAMHGKKGTSPRILEQSQELLLLKDFQQKIEYLEYLDQHIVMGETSLGFIGLRRLED